MREPEVHETKRLWPESEMGLLREAKWGQTPVSVQAGFVRPSGPCFFGVARKAKRNGCFCGCDWESLALSPPIYVCEQEGPVQYQWVRCLTKSTRYSFTLQPGPQSHPVNPFKPTRSVQPHCDHLIAVIAPRAGSVTGFRVSPKSVPPAREGLTGGGDLRPAMVRFLGPAELRNRNMHRCGRAAYRSFHARCPDLPVSRAPRWP